jgi:hypothetical protein
MKTDKKGVETAKLSNETKKYIKYSGGSNCGFMFANIFASKVVKIVVRGVKTPMEIEHEVSEPPEDGMT